MTGDKEVSPAVQHESSSYWFGHFLRRRHKSMSPYKFFLIFFTAATCIKDNTLISTGIYVEHVSMYTLNNLIGEGVYCSDCLHNLSEAIFVPRSLIDIHGYISLCWLSSLSIISTLCEEYFCRQFSRFRLCVLRTLYSPDADFFRNFRFTVRPQFRLLTASTVPVVECVDSFGYRLCLQFRLLFLSIVLDADYVKIPVVTVSTVPVMIVCTFELPVMSTVPVATVSTFQLLTVSTFPVTSYVDTVLYYILSAS
jgi:hypothetical protein